ncbi:DUF2530 domain-containing protein [Naumannella cuiyingiana]|uniref:DUF2530 domain-containing protein n=1 Tax=Naumannella cuiyingiana TaxID=1347891 RepID=A0A7Z0DAA3_9ACTN|nr:DUF2530 domain-containing protein [Naumannella cuiyingiana]NYI71664.1 hypothetical protein [Naumannella cuiyingiana]
MARNPAPVRPLDVDGIGAAVVGTLAWLAALVACLVFRAELAARDSEWWIGVCVAGAALGVIGFGYATWRRRRR